MPGRPTNVPPETGERLRNIRESLGLNRSEFVEKVGMGLSSLSRMEAGKVPPSAEVIYYLACQHPQVDIRELFCGIPTPSRIDAYEVASQVKPVIRAVGAPIDDLPPENVADDYVAVPMLDGKVAAGPGGVIWEQVKSLVWLYKPQLKGRAKLVAVRVGGDSMVPTVPEGSIVIVDRDQWIPNGGRKNIWALRTEDGDTQIKRLHKAGKKKNKHLIVMSDNFTEYPPEPAWTLDMKELVIGKVIWMWQSLE